MYDVAIIGAGIIGTFIARELSRYDLKIALIEKDSDVANGTTKANSAIVHAGYDAEPGTLKAKFNALGNPMFDKICEELDVPFKRVGSLVVAHNEEEMETIKELYNRGIENNIPSMRILNKEEVLAKEPNLNEDIIGALYAPTCGIVGPFELAIALTENAMENGAELFLNSAVLDIEKGEEGYKIHTENRVINSKLVINCAGVYADEINNMVAPVEYKIKARRGQYFVLDKSAGNIVNSVVFQCPTKLGKGVLLTQTVHGNLIVGPDSQYVEDKEDIITTEERLNYVKETAVNTCRNIPFNKVITSFAGLRAASDSGDFIIGESEYAKGFINVGGIESPGLSAAPAIAQHVVSLVKDIVGEAKEKKEFNPRREVIRFMELSDEEKSKVIKDDSRYGTIICRCEGITEGEIVDCIRRKGGATTVDGVKRRARPGMGRCQGGFCAPRVMEILSRELQIDMQDVVKSSPKSKILISRTKDQTIQEETREQCAAVIENREGEDLC